MLECLNSPQQAWQVAFQRGVMSSSKCTLKYDRNEKELICGLVPTKPDTELGEGTKARIKAGAIEVYYVET